MGGALSYTDGDSDLKNGGDADNWMLTGAVYGTWHNEKGHYVDLVGKVTRMHNKYKVISGNSRPREATATGPTPSVRNTADDSGTGKTAILPNRKSR